jgi:hypothetical protein
MSGSIKMEEDEVEEDFHLKKLSLQRAMIILEQQKLDLDIQLLKAMAVSS